MTKVIAIACSDIHLSHSPPIARSEEPDWYEAMARPLRELQQLQNKYAVPILCAGDIFHKWNSPPELINFALRELPEMWAIPGQHDLPYHRYEDIRKSAYWTLVSSEKIEHLGREEVMCLDQIGLRLTGFPWDHEPENRKKYTDDGFIDIALIHKYIYSNKRTKFTDAPKEAHIKNLKLRGYDIAVFGDNHIGFSSKVGDTKIFNCGSLMCRNIDQIDFAPRVGLIKSDCTIETCYMDCSQDVFIEPSEKSKETIDAEGLIEDLKGIDSPESFRDRINQTLESKKVNRALKSEIGEILDEAERIQKK